MPLLPRHCKHWPERREVNERKGKEGERERVGKKIVEMPYISYGKKWYVCAYVPVPAVRRGTRRTKLPKSWGTRIAWPTQYPIANNRKGEGSEERGNRTENRYGCEKKKGEMDD